MSVETSAAESPRPQVSFIVPTFNEEESLDELVTRITDVCRQEDLRFEIVLIDDGSTDQSWQVIERLAVDSEPDSAERVRGIRFRRNFGKAAGLQAGIDASRGEIIITMDADLQDDPVEIPRFLQMLDDGHDVVSGWKKVRHDPWHKTLPSRVFNGMVSRLTGVKLHDHNCGFKAYRREVFDEVVLYGERHRFVPVLAAARGWRVAEIVVQHHARKFGHSKYGLSRLVKGFLDLLTIYLLTGYSGRPFHLIGTAGMACFATGGMGIFYLSAMWVVSRMSASIEDVELHKRAIFYYCILAVLLGGQFLVGGLLAELLVSRTSKDHPQFSIAQTTKSQTTGDHDNA